MDLNRQDAQRIANKLGAEQREGRKHKVVTVRHDGKELGKFNIRHSRGASHAYVPTQIGLSYTQAKELASCTLSKDQFLVIHGVAESTGSAS